MCGILGFSGSFKVAELASGLRAIAHRGPDDSGIFVDEQAALGLGNVRLSIQDLSPLGHQPMATSDGAVVLTYNGEIYNFRELRTELQAKGHRFRGDSDTEVVLNLYLTEGEAMLTRLNGIFAFALWDARRKLLFLARDALGVKPFYYSATQRGVVFASEIKGMLSLVPEVRTLDASSLHRYLTFLWCPGEGTPLKAVRKLLPGEAMMVKDGRIARRWTWYRGPAQRGIQPRPAEAHEVAVTAGHVRRAVQRQMVADVPVGAFLSGGLDSSSVVAFARETDPSVRCFTIDVRGGQEEGTADDLPYARAVARHLDVALEVVRVDSSTLANDLPLMISQLEEPLADPAPLNVLYISRLAREHGIKVLLSGAGGDDLFTGYRRHRALSAERYWAWLPQQIRSAIKWATSTLDHRSPVARRLAKAFAGADLDAERRIAHYFVWANYRTLLPLYSSPFLDELSSDRAEAPLLDFLSTIPSSVPRLERMLALEQRFFLADHNLIYTDKMSMAAGVEVRVPFLDLDLVEHAANIPHRLKQRGSVGKWILKKAMEPYLPKEVIYRPKTGFGAPLRRWMKNELRPLLGELLSANRLTRRGLFEPAAVQRLIALNDAGKADAAYTLLSLLSIELWCCAFLDNQPIRAANS